MFIVLLVVSMLGAGNMHQGLSYFIENSKKHSLSKGADSSLVRRIGYFPMGSPQKCVLSTDNDTIMYEAVGKGILVFNLKNGAAPVNIGSKYIGERVNDLFYYQGRLYVAAGKELIVYAVSDTAFLQKQGAFETIGKAMGVYVSANYAYVADGNYGLRILDITDPQNTYEISYYYTPGYAGDVCVQDGLAYVADGNYGLRIIDVHNPSSPYEVSYYDTLGYTFDVRISPSYGNYVLTADYNGIHLLDVTVPSNVYVFDSWYCSDSITALHWAGSYVYVADTKGVLHAVDISSTPFTETGYYPTHDRANSLFVRGRYAYVNDNSEGMLILDVYNPYNIEETGFCETPGYASTVYVVNSTSMAYVADGDSGVSVVDISDIQHPVRVNFAETHAYARDVAVLGDHMYVATVGRGLEIFDISTPYNPVYVIELPSEKPLLSVDVDTSSGSNIVLVTDSTSVYAIDVTNANSPRVLSTYTTQGTAYNVTFFGYYAYVADGENGVVILDMHDPNNPYVVANYNTQGCVYDIYVSEDNFAYVADGENGVVILDVSDISNPQRVAHITVEGKALGVYGPPVIGGYGFLHVTQGEYGFSIIDVTQPQNPYEVGYYDTDGFARGVFVSDYIYIADGSDGLRIFQGGQTSIHKAGHYDIPDRISDVKVFGNYAGITDEKTGYYVLNVSNPGNMYITGHCATQGDARALFIAGHYAFIADGSAGLSVLEMSTVSSISLIGNIPTVDTAYDVALYGSYAYVVDGNGGLRVIDVSSPENPVEIANLETPDFAYSVYISDTCAFVGDGNYGLRIVNIATPNDPQEIGCYYAPSPVNVTSVYVQDDYAYMTDKEDGLRIIDVRDRTKPQEKDYFETPDSAMDVWVNGNYAYIADYSGGLRVIDISDSTSPHETGYYVTDGVATVVYADSSNVYVADYSVDDDGYVSSGVGVYNFSNSDVMEEERRGSFNDYVIKVNSMNSIDFSIEVPERKNIACDVYDIAGKRVLQKETNGKEVSVKRNVPSGVYFVIANVKDGKTITTLKRKLIVIK